MVHSADLNGAKLTGANLTGANLTGAKLTGANLTGVNLYGASLNSASLNSEDLNGANLGRADLTDANLYGANLTRANLTRANLGRANLTDANLWDPAKRRLACLTLPCWRSRSSSWSEIQLAASVKFSLSSHTSGRSSSWPGYGPRRCPWSGATFRCRNKRGPHRGGRCASAASTELNMSSANSWADPDRGLIMGA
jgi:uncharacterized protein YjbI with pentapeptide repeats